ncbi:MAG: hypothetical protein MUF16_10550 [Burkholderiaceae bacterium]|jgi:hypothetical protein|nr:hypothetical protein [Burkholderiaceae bacterium]
MLLLQRRMCGRDGSKWTAVLRLEPTTAQVSAAKALAEAAMELDPQTEWRIVGDSPDAVFIAVPQTFASASFGGQKWVIASAYYALLNKNRELERAR